MSSRIHARSTCGGTLCHPLARYSTAALLVLLPTTACSDDGPSAPEGVTETPAPVLSSVSPNTLVEGGSITLRGSDFSTTASANVVRIDGVTATVTAATATQLSVIVPVFDCRPQRPVDVQVSRSGKASNPLAAEVSPAAFVNGAPGEMLLVDDPSDFCLQFAPASAGAGEYLVGIGSAAERPDLLFDVTLTAETGLPAPATVLAGAAGSSTMPGRGMAVRAIRQVRTDEDPAPVPPTTERYSGGEPTTRASGLEGRHWHERVQQRLARLAREALDRARSESKGSTGARPGRPLPTRARTPEVGDRIEIKVPNFAGTTLEDACASIPITADVRVVGERAIFVTDVANPTADPLTDAELQSFSDPFDSFVYDADTEYFGEPSDLDENGRVIVVLTVEVNKAIDGLIGGAVFPLDLFPTSICPGSNVGEVYYHEVPDPENAAGTRARLKATITDRFVKFMAHEFAHILQHSVRLRHGLQNSIPLSLWEMEGQAGLAIEIVGHAALGNSPGRDYGAATALSETGQPWYRGRLEGLANYYGYDESDGGRHPDAPETCTALFSSQLGPSGCTPGATYGASWSFFRYLADRYGPEWPGGEAGFMRDWIDLNPGLQGAANVEALLGRPFRELFAEWAAMHYLDAHVPSVDPALLMNSWDLGDVLPALGANATLEPRGRTFAAFTASVAVRGGSTAYSLFGDAAARPATALRFRNADDGVLGGDMKPVLWVVRTR